jgi:hypothetical protein
MLLGSSCGSERATLGPRNTAFRPGQFQPSLRVRGQLPGRRVSLSGLPRNVVGASVRELLRTGRGKEQLPLYVGRDRAYRLCVGTTARWECLQPVDAQPVFAFTPQGGHGAIRDGAIVGIAAPDVRVTVGRGVTEVALPLRRLRGFGWAAFASPLWQNRAPDTLNFYDRAGRRLSGFLDLAFSPNPCGHRGGNCTPHGLWHVIGDPWGDASGASRSLEEQAKRLVFADRTVRALLGGRRSAFNPAALWSRCRGGTIGAVINLTFAPATLTADCPQVDYDPKSHTAYVERTLRYKISNVTSCRSVSTRPDGRSSGSIARQRPPSRVLSRRSTTSASATSARHVRRVGRTAVTARVTGTRG